MLRRHSALWIYPMWGAYATALVMVGQHHYVVAFALWVAGTWSAVRT